MEENNIFAEFIKKHRKEAGLTQKEFALKSGLGLRFIRELEQGKQTLR
ncbi:MAG TPA: helix-turn-helix domain-containing protein, partial [Treponemataceae bacterium]|nr:helix-turn-helix domain-containing protein [Treponemataceae bacterium]